MSPLYIILNLISTLYTNITDRLTHAHTHSHIHKHTVLYTIPKIKFTRNRECQHTGTFVTFTFLGLVLISI